MSETEQHRGTAIAAYRRYTLVKDQNNNLFQCQQRKSVGQVVCGDIVNWQQEDIETGVITSVEERHSILQSRIFKSKTTVAALSGYWLPRYIYEC